MKRFLVLALVAMLVVAMLAVPAFADSVYTAYFEHNMLVLPEMPTPGTYRLSFSIDYGDDGVTEAVVVENVKLVQVSDDIDGFLSGEFMFNDDASGEHKLILIVARNDPGFNPDFPEWAPILVYIGMEGSGDYAPLASLTLERVTEPVSGEEAAVDSVLGVFTGIGSWLVAELGNATSLFYQADTGLTILGVLAVAGLGIAVVFLLINWIKSLLQFRS